MKKVLAICLVLSLLMFSGVAMSQGAKGAAPGASWFGPTGLILIPTAESLGKGELRFHVNAVTLVDEDNVPLFIPGIGIVVLDNWTRTEMLPAITFGLTENLEITLGSNIVEDEVKIAGQKFSEKSTNPMISAKYVVPVGKTEAPQLLAVGLIHKKYDVYGGSETQNSLYVVTSYALEAVKLHGGLYVTKTANGSDETSTQFAAGVEFPVIAKLTLSGEYVSKEKGAEDPTIAIGGRYSFTPNISAQIGSVDFGYGEQKIFAGVALKFGGKK